MFNILSNSFGRSFNALVSLSNMLFPQPEGLAREYTYSVFFCPNGKRVTAADSFSLSSKWEGDVGESLFPSGDGCLSHDGPSFHLAPGPSFSEFWVKVWSLFPLPSPPPPLFSEQP